MAITWNTPTQPVQSGGIKWNNPPPAETTGTNAFSAAQGALGHITNFTNGIFPGIAKSVGGTVAEMSQLGGNIADKVTGAVLGPKGTSNALDQANVETANQLFTPQGPGEQIGNAIGELGQFLGSGGLDLIKGSISGIKTVPAILDAVKAKGVGGLFKDGVEGAKKIIQEFSANRATDTSIEAVNPSLTPAKLTKATKEVVTGGRELTPKSMFHEQGLTPDQRTTNLGTRLQDLQLGNEPKQNLETLRTGMQDTEQHLQDLLGDPATINLNADKSGLTKRLEGALNEAPTEHRIKDTENMMGHVTDYAKKLVSDAKLNFQGVRDAKTAFYNGAKKEFPNAFTDTGSIDTKSPAGYAIQKIGETMSEHLYHSAPEGSIIRDLIGREADIFRATENIAPKAAKEIQDAIDAKDEGKLAELMQKYPKTFKYLKLSLGALGADYALKKTTGIGI